MHALLNLDFSSEDNSVSSVNADLLLKKSESNNSISDQEMSMLLNAPLNHFGI